MIFQLPPINPEVLEQLRVYFHELEESSFAIMAFVVLNEIECRERRAEAAQRMGSTYFEPEPKNFDDASQFLAKFRNSGGI